MAEDWEDFTGDDLSPDEQQVLRFQYENALQLKAANLGFDMDRFQRNPVGRHLLESAIDVIHNSMLALIDIDLSTIEARRLQTEARAAKLLIDTVLVALDGGRDAAFKLADEVEIVEDSDG